MELAPMEGNAVVVRRPQVLQRVLVTNRLMEEWSRRMILVTLNLLF